MSRLSEISFEPLEPYDGKLSCTVLRGERGSNAPDLPDITVSHSLLNIQSLKEKIEQKNNAMKKINIGDWVTQYRTGYWKVKELHPKYSPFDCDRLHKGEPIGVEAVLQKAFNNTFKFNMEMSTCDLSLCQHVTKAVMRKIEKYFKEHPDDEIKFETSQLPVPPNVTAIHLNIDDAQRDHISSLLNIELPNLTYPKVKEILSDNGLTEVLCGAENTLLFLYGYSWEQNENFDMIYSKYDFKRK